MARPREFDEGMVLDAAVQSFWRQGYEATSVRDLIETTGLTGASLYNAFGDKRSLYQKALARYVEERIAWRIHRCAGMAPRQALSFFFGDVLRRALDDEERKGCMLVNTALDVAPHDAQLQEAVDKMLLSIERFFRARIEEGQADGSFARTQSAANLARHLLSTLMGIHVLARIRPEKALLQGVVESALAMLDAAAS